MDTIVYVPAVVLALPFLAIYTFACVRRTRRFNLAILVSILLYSSGVCAGALLMAGTFFKDLQARLTGLQLYIFIGGLAVLAVSVQGLARDVFQKDEVEKR